MNILDDKSRTELQRYIRLFCSRSLQVIIQSRLQASIKNFGKNKEILNDHFILICKFFLIKKDTKSGYIRKVRNWQLFRISFLYERIGRAQVSGNFWVLHRNTTHFNPVQLWHLSKGVPGFKKSARIPLNNSF